MKTGCIAFPLLTKLDGYSIVIVIIANSYSASTGHLWTSFHFIIKIAKHGMDLFIPLYK